MKSFRAFFGLIGLAGLCIAPVVAFCEDGPKYIELTGPPAATIGDEFQVDVTVVPKPLTPVKIFMEQGTITYDKGSFTIKPGQHEILIAKAVSSRDGLGWLHARAEGYDDQYLAINLGFSGRLKLDSSDRLPFGRGTTLTLSIVDKDGKPFPLLPSNLSLQLDSQDAPLNRDSKWVSSLDIPLNSGDRISPQFQIQPTSRVGGPVHLKASLLVHSGMDIVLEQEAFTLNSEPVTWLPILLSVSGGLMYGIYRIASGVDLGSTNQAWKGVGLLVTTCVAGFVGYLIANLDLLGLKLDPNLLRTYPLIGFLVAYIGFDTLLSKKFKPR